MQMHQQMMGEMKAGHERLDGLIATMKSATVSQARRHRHRHAWLIAAGRRRRGDRVLG
jgi:hypothetical protein